MPHQSTNTSSQKLYTRYSFVRFASSFHMESLPQELLLKILYYLPMSDVLKLKQTCNALRCLPINYFVCWQIYRDNVDWIRLKKWDRANHRLPRLDISSLKGSDLLDSRPLAFTARFGHLQEVRGLLAKGIDPSLGESLAFRNAATNGYAEIVALLIKDARVDPGSGHNDAIRWAAYDGHLDVVELLLQCPKVDPSDRHNYALRFSAGNGHLPVVERLLMDHRVDPSDDNNYAIRQAARYGQYDVVKRLLEDQRVDPSAEDCEALRWAAYNGHEAVVRLLLSDPRVNPCSLDNDALNSAKQRGHLEIKRLLLDHHAHQKLGT